MSQAQVKQALVEKYERLAAVAKSKPKKKQFLHKADKYRNQVKLLTK